MLLIMMSDNTWVEFRANNHEYETCVGIVKNTEEGLHYEFNPRIDYEEMLSLAFTYYLRGCEVVSLDIEGKDDIPIDLIHKNGFFPKEQANVIRDNISN